ncbi:hypothetical protein LTR41_005634 [Exophiala xenobiotica]|nr:hypothetical protein LTR41_005634 [Exophiala xenobiotica]
MIRWLEGHQREGTKALLTRPQETTVPPTEDTPVFSGETALSTQNNPLDPTPFDPIEPVELLAYEEPTLVDNEAEWPAYLELMEDLDVLYNGAQARPILWFVSRSVSSVTIHPNGWTPFLDRFSQWHSHIHLIYVCKEMSELPQSQTLGQAQHR